MNHNQLVTLRKDVQNISIDLPGVTLPGILTGVEQAKGLIIFAHGAGSSRLSPRNTQVSDYLNNRHFSTLLFDLLTEEEDRFIENRFNIDLIAERLAGATRFIETYPEIGNLPFGYFGASTGAAAALLSSIQFPERVKAVVSRGGRPDLVLPKLRKVTAATLLIVGSYDYVVIDLNEQAFQTLNTEKKIIIIPEATHLFEEAGKLEEVSKDAGEWFEMYL